MYFHRTIVAVGLCLLVCAVALADVTNQRYQLSLIRGSTTVETVYAPTQAEVWARCADRVAALSETGNPNTVYICQTLRYYATAVATCQPAPAPQTRPQSCPAGTTGTWTQTSTATVSPAPACNVTVGPWLPTTAPSGACAPIPPPPSGTATLSWTHDGANTDGYRINYGTSPTALAQTIQVSGSTARSYTVTGLPPGTWYFAVKAYRGGTESESSAVRSKVIL